MSEKPRRRARRQTPEQQADQLATSQISLLQALRVNQDELINRIEHLVRPVEAQVERLREEFDQIRVLMNAMSGQIDQLNERQELQERQLSELPLAEQEKTA
jgi:flagellar capping protein FliD